MRLSERDFFLNKLDLSISELKNAAECFEEGNINGAYKTFARYMKSVLRPELRFQIPENPHKEHSYKEETWTDMIMAGYVAPVGYVYRFPYVKIIWDHNPMPNKYVEWVFHLQSHGELVYMGRAYKKTGREMYARKAAEIISSWIEQVERPEKWSPCYRTLETGNRLVNAWPYFVHVFMNSPSISDELWTKIFISVWEQADWLYHTNSNRNWLITEMRGLLTTAVTYPFFKDATAWYDRSINTLIDELHVQIYPDGVATDRSFTYQSGMTEGYCQIITLLNLYGKNIPKELKDGLYKVFRMYCLMSNPTLTLGAPNDCSHMRSTRMANLALTLFPDDEIFKYFASERKEGKAPEEAMQIFPYSGFATLRSDWSEKGMWLFFDSGAPDYNSGWHVHESCLNIELYAYGTDMLRDPGTYHYDTSKMREYVCSTRSHNCGLVDGMGQLCFAKTDIYGFIDTTQKSRIISSSDENFDIVQGYYDFGYGKNFRPDKAHGEKRDNSNDSYAKHTRKIIFAKNGLGDAKPFFVMLDRFETMDEKEHLYELSFQLDEVKADVIGNSVKVTYANGATLSMISCTAPEIILGQTEPELAGWKPELDHNKDHRPAPLVNFAKSGKNALFATVLYPSPNEEAPEIEIAELSDSLVTLKINGQNYSLDI
ncbi:MAG: hypothetical protein E7633_01485 [Ruminococcaceae bacterium]|nr:hypothetical protein [Oscillospiraceae bacterium]